MNNRRQIFPFLKSIWNSAWGKISAFLIGLALMLTVLNQVRDTYFNFFPKEPLFFSAEPAIINSKDTLLIYAGNEYSKQERPLSIEYDGVILLNAGRLEKTNGTVRWFLKLNENQNLTDKNLSTGTHSIKAGFNGEFSANFCIEILNEAPLTQGTIDSKLNSIGDSLILDVQGAILSSLKDSNNELRVILKSTANGRVTQAIATSRLIQDSVIGDYYLFHVKKTFPIGILNMNNGEGKFEIISQDAAGNEITEIISYSEISPGSKIDFGGNFLDTVGSIELHSKNGVLTAPEPKPTGTNEIMKTKGKTFPPFSYSSESGFLKNLESLASIGCVRKKEGDYVVSIEFKEGVKLEDIAGLKVTVLEFEKYAQVSEYGQSVQLELHGRKASSVLNVQNPYNDENIKQSSFGIAVLVMMKSETSAPENNIYGSVVDLKLEDFLPKP